LTEPNPTAFGNSSVDSGLRHRSSILTLRDQDEDGLIARDEVLAYFTDPFNEDTDFYDMWDGWEVANGLDPLSNDAGEDPDGDMLPNVYEQSISSDPHDDASPAADLYVATTGNGSGAGTPSDPWTSVWHAMAAASIYTAYGIYEKPISVHLAAGTYEEPVSLVPNVTLEGAGQEVTVLSSYQPSPEGHIGVLGADNAGLRSLTVTMPGVYPTVSTLLWIDNVNMMVEDVAFDANLNRYSTGILISGTGSSESVIRDCAFRELENGIWAVNSGVNITANHFEDILSDAVFAQRPARRKSGDAPLLGSATMADTTGNNVFGLVDGRFVRNFSGMTILAENNDWGIYDAEAIAAKMSGSVDFQPFVGQSPSEGEGEGEGEPPFSCQQGSLGGGPGARMGDAVTLCAIALTMLCLRRRTHTA